MDIAFTSLCTGRAARRTARILDAYTIRTAKRTWTASLSDEALAQLHIDLRSAACEKTAVAALRVNAVGEPATAWTVGNKKMLARGGFIADAPVDASILTDRYTFVHRRLLTAIVELAALCHDLGKASKGFQKMLRGLDDKRFSTVRHEVMSACVAREMLEGKKSWEQAWQTVQMSQSYRHLPFGRLDSPLDLMLAMVYTHHRLVDGGLHIGSWKATTKDHLHQKVPVDPDDVVLSDPDWRPFNNDVARRYFFRAARILTGHTQCDSIETLHMPATPGGLHGVDSKALPAMFHRGRTVLQLSDHHYSAHGQPGDTLPLDGDRASVTRISANTIWLDGGKSRRAHQPLNEHLAGVCKNVEGAMQMLELARFSLPAIDSGEIALPGDVPARFLWQPRAVEVTKAARAANPGGGFFGVINASTGCGKTIASVRVAAAAGGESARLTVATPMRVLARQTHAEYAQRTMIDGSNLAIAVGGISIDDDDARKQAKSKIQQSESAPEDDDFDVYSGGVQHKIPQLINQFFGHTAKVRNFVGAPVLVCTIDYINRAMEPHRGRHLVAYTRLVSADLIVDEADEYALAVLLRIVYFTGLAGRNVFLSTATMHAEAVSQLYQAYRAGYESFCAMRGRPFSTNVLLLSETEQDALKDPTDIRDVVEKMWLDRVASLRAAPVLRRAEIVDSPETDGVYTESVFAKIVASIRLMHDRNHVTTHGCRVSAGAIRLDRVDDCARFAIYLTRHAEQAGLPFKFLVNHGRFTNAERAYKNYQLAKMLRRGGPSDPLLEDPDILSMTTQYDDSTFIVIMSSAGERGSDLDFDWEIIEPTSLDGMIQVVGRANRHRRLEKRQPNIAILRFPINNGRGFKKDIHRVDNPDMLEAVNDEFLLKMDARALLGDARLQDMPLLQAANRRLLNGGDFFKMLAMNDASAQIGVTIGGFYEPPLREQDKRMTIEIDEDSQFRNIETGAIVPLGYQTYGHDNIFAPYMLTVWRRKDIYEFVNSEGGLNIWQQKVGRQISHPNYEYENSVDSDEKIWTSSDVFGLANLRAGDLV